MSRKRDISSVFLIVAVVTTIFAAAFFVLYHSMRPTTTLRVGDGIFHAVVVSTDSAWVNELSSTRNLSRSEAVLSVYTTDEIRSVNGYMIGSPVDIAWVDKSKRIVYIVKNIQPDDIMSDTVYTPKEDMRYLILFAAGTVDSRSIRAGQTAVFQEESV